MTLICLNLLFKILTHYHHHKRKLGRCFNGTNTAITAIIQVNHGVLTADNKLLTRAEEAADLESQSSLFAEMPQPKPFDLKNSF